jgi:hypothetical protein
VRVAREAVTLKKSSFEMAKTAECALSHQLPPYEVLQPPVMSGKMSTAKKVLRP